MPPRTLSLLLLLLTSPLRAADPWVVYDGTTGTGNGKHLVLVSGDEEYRSEETLPQLGRILAKHHGFKCTVLFAIDKKDGSINPNERGNIPGLDALKTADLAILFLRFRELPDEQMKYLVDYVEAGKPVLGIRTSTHAFNMKQAGTYGRWNWQSPAPKGGFGKLVLGETWVNHHGGHGTESTRGILSVTAKDHPILRGIKDGDIWGTTDVYGVRLPLPGDSMPLVLGEVVAGMKEKDKAVSGKKNDPMMPIAWVKSYTPEGGKKARIFTSTMGSSQDLENEGYRRLLVNASYWCVGLEDKIPTKSKVDLVGTFKASPFRNNGFKKGVKPAELR